jgi:hypothetical protein
MKEKKRYTAILALTAMGCVCGVVMALLLSHFCRNRENGSYVLACDSEQTTGQSSEIVAENNSDIISPQWLFYQSQGGSKCKEETRKYFDILVNRWTNGKLTDDELGELMTEYLTKQGVVVATSGIQSKALCLFASAGELPDYTQMLTMGESIYDFIGVYTQGQYDDEGRLICYYWEAGVR